MEDILGLGRPAPSGAASRIKTWVRAARGLDDDVVVMVSELSCHEDGCPDVETVIVVMQAGAEAKTKLPKPMAEVTEAEIQAWR